MATRNYNGGLPLEIQICHLFRYLAKQKKIVKILEGTNLTILTPGRKRPQLKTTLTRPQNVFLENLSPLYRHTVSPTVPQLSDVYKLPVVSTGSSTELGTKADSLENLHEDIEIGTPNKARCEKRNGSGNNQYEEPFDKTDVAVTDMTEAYVKKVNKNVETDRTKDIKDLKRRGPSGICGDDHFSKVDFSGIEAQIIPKSLLHVSARDVEKSPTFNVLPGFKSQFSVCDSGSQGNETINEESQRLCNFENGNQNKGITEGGRRRRYTPSFCSSCSCDDSVIAQSRCSVCDGCSSSTCNSLCSHAEPSRVGSGGDCGDSFLHPCEMSATKIDSLLDSHLSFDDLDAGLLKSHDEVDTLKAKDCPNKLSLSTEQLIFLLLRMVLSKYKHLTDDLTLEKKTSKSQRQSIAYLIQAVLLLSRRVKNTSEQWHKTQTQLALIQTEHARLRKQHRKICFVLCILLFLNVCRIPAVKQRMMKVMKFFGFVENVRKINRLRKMIAENWRNIPSLLTDFWRIFIFRSTTRLKNS